MRRRLLAAILGVSIAGVALFAIPLAITLKDGYRDDELLKLQRDTVASTRQIDLANTQNGDPLELPAGADRLAVYRRDGSLIAGHGPNPAPAFVSSAMTADRITERGGGGTLQAAVPLLTGEKVSGVVLAVRSDSAVAARTRSAWLALAGLAALIGVLAALAAVVLSRRLAAPLERLAASARRLGDGDFAVRAPRSGLAETDAVGEALDSTAERLGDVLQRERSFTEDASHQLRNPLAAIRLELETLELRGDSPPEATRALGEVDRLQATIDTLLAAARGAPAREQPADVRTVLVEVEDRWRGPLAAKGRPLRSSQSGPEPMVKASPAVIAEVLEVLLDNATKHGTGEVTLAVRDASGSVAVDVCDEGPGFGDEVDDPFARRPANGDGHGIGLALARSLARSEGGDLVIANRSEGPTLTLLLPRA